MINVDLIHFFFEYFFKKKYGEGIRLNQTPTTKKHSETFLSLLDKAYGKSVGYDFLYRYFCFQFDYWDRLDLKANTTYNKQIQLSFIIGKKAFDRFQGRNVEYDWQLETLPFIQKYRIRKSDIVNKNTKNKSIVNTAKVDTEAPIKLAMYNKPEGFLNCIDFSTMYNHKSKICNGCKFKDKCKEMLKKVHPSIYTDRGYA